MTGDKLLRAMSYVDEDLVEKAEKWAAHPAGKGIWVRVAALAACLCLALGGWMMIKAVFPTVFSAKNAAPRSQDTGGMNAMAEAAPQEAAEGAGEEASQDREAMQDQEPVMTMETAKTGEAPGDWYIQSESAMELSAPRVIRTCQALEALPVPPEVLERYGEDFFETQDLLLAAFGSGPEHPQVIDLEDTGDGWLLTVSAAAEGEDAARWWLLLPIEKDQIPENEEIMIKEEETK